MSFVVLLSVNMKANSSQIYLHGTEPVCPLELPRYCPVISQHEKQQQNQCDILESETTCLVVRNNNI